VSVAALPRIDVQKYGEPPSVGGAKVPTK